MSIANAINLQQLPMPAVVDPLDYELIFNAMLAEFQNQFPQFSAVLESDPVIKLLEIAAYRELNLRQTINDKARAVMLAFAVGSDLDQFCADFNIARRVIDPGDLTAIPPRLPVFESDEALRARRQLAPEALTVAGSIGAYQFHALAASVQVKDVGVTSPAPSDIVVTILSTIGDGVANTGLLDIVRAALSDKQVRPLGDRVTVQSAAIISYSLSVSLEVYEGPDKEVVRLASLGALQSYVVTHHRLGDPVTLSGIHAAATVAGVKRAITAFTDINPTSAQAAYCTSLSVTVTP